MSTTQSTGLDPNTKRQRLKTYLKRNARDGELYFKSKFIADKVGLSPKEIGALMGEFEDLETDLDIERWSYTGATTWRVALK
jgi:hypothetical protein